MTKNHGWIKMKCRPNSEWRINVRGHKGRAPEWRINYRDQERVVVGGTIVAGRTDVLTRVPSGKIASEKNFEISQRFGVSFKGEKDNISLLPELEKTERQGKGRQGKRRKKTAKEKTRNMLKVNGISEGEKKSQWKEDKEVARRTGKPSENSRRQKRWMFCQCKRLH